MMLEKQLALVPVTWAAFEAACHALPSEEEGEPLHPDDVLAGQAVPRVAPGEAGPLLAVVLQEEPEGLGEDGLGEDGEETQLAAAAGQLFFEEALAAAARGTERAKRYAERAAVWDRMQGGTGVPPSLSRVLARYDPAEYDRLRTMPLEEMMCYLLLQSANATSDEMKRARGRRRGL